MPDYGHDLLFGTFVPPAAGAAEGVLKLAELTDRLGLELLGIQDHPYQPAFLDTWTLLSVIAARTERVRVFPDVANLPLRPPAVLAKAAASLDVLSGGRAELGLGSGAFAEGVAALGGPRRSASAGVDALAEAIAVIRSLWRPDGRAVRFDGEHYQLDGAQPGPVPAHPIGIWVGAYKPRMLALTGRLADGWLPSTGYADPSALAEMNARIDEAAVDAGRSPADVRRLYNIGGGFGAEQLAELALADGMSGFILATDVGREDEVRRFAEEVVPAVRELVAAERASGGASTAEAAVTVGVRPGDRSGAAADAVVAPPEPTAPPAARLSAELPSDEAARPRGPEPAPGLTYTEWGRDGARRLIAIHDHLRQELDQVRDLIEQVAGGTLSAGAARSVINTMTMRQNKWTLGTYCESYCRVVATHHTIEDLQMLPALRAADPRLAGVTDRLAEEHEVIAAVLERVDAALVALVAPGDDGAALAEVRRSVDLLTDALLSHLSYEERELVEPLTRLPLEI